MSRQLRKCIDCGRLFEAWSDMQIRCPECQREHRREYDRQRHRRTYEEHKYEKATQSLVVNGHVQVCKVMHKCYYGCESRSGCSYALEEGETRRSRGLWIENGKCPAYKPKKRNEALRRSKLSMVNSNNLSNKEIYHKFNEI